MKNIYFEISFWRRSMKLQSHHPLFGMVDYYLFGKIFSDGWHITKATTIQLVSSCVLWTQINTDSGIPQEQLLPGYYLRWPLWKPLNRLRLKVGSCRDKVCIYGGLGMLVNYCEYPMCDVVPQHSLCSTWCSLLKVEFESKIARLITQLRRKRQHMRRYMYLQIRRKKSHHFRFIGYTLEMYYTIDVGLKMF